MPLFVADYLADTGELDCAEHGAYLLLIMHYWQRGSLPDDNKKLASIARASLEQWTSMRQTIAGFFEDGWRHPRIDAELEKSKKAYEKRAAAGRSGGNAKAERQQSSSNARAGLYHPLLQSQEKPNGFSPREGAPKKSPKQELMEAFDGK